MTWTRTKRWIGEHPFLATSAGILVASTAWSPAWAAQVAYLPTPPILDCLPGLLILVTLAAIAALACWIGIVRYRAGLRRWYVLFQPAWVGGMVLTVCGSIVFMCGLRGEFTAASEVSVLVMWLGYWLFLFGGHAMGAAAGTTAAYVLARIMRRLGKWEVTRPPWVEDKAAPPVQAPAVEEDPS